MTPHLVRRIRNPRSLAASVARKSREWVLRHILAGSKEVTLNRWQAAFCDWNAERLSINRETAVERFMQSQSAVRDGHSSVEYRIITEAVHNILEPFASDTTPHEAFDAYKLHAELHMLRFLSYEEPKWSISHPLVQPFLTSNKVTIVDFGCGVAQQSLTLAEWFHHRGVSVNVGLADVDTVMLDFMRSHASRFPFDVEIWACTPEEPIPDMFPADIVVATEVLEHVHDPLHYFSVLDGLLGASGMMLANVEDHHDEFLHVSPELGALRQEMAQRGYRDVGFMVHWKQPGSAVRDTDQ